MIMRDAIAKLIGALKNEFVICANGFISRDTFNAVDRPRNFYMLGSMGHASSIGLGLALAKPSEKVVIFDGDGNLLMNLGILAMISQLKPKNLVHIVLDNESYDSTGGQPTVSSVVDLSEAAKGCGIAKVYAKRCDENFVTVFKDCLRQEGPSFLLIKVGRDASTVAPRIDIEPDKITERFRRS